MTGRFGVDGIAFVVLRFGGCIVSWFGVVMPIMQADSALLCWLSSAVELYAVLTISSSDEVDRRLWPLWKT